MTGMIFQLILVTCLTVNDWRGDFMSRTCKGDPDAFYTNMEKCNTAGVASYGRNVFRDSVIIGSSERVESHRCVGIQVQ